MAGSDEANYALNIALKTLRERCQNLEGRLTTVEEENHQLRLKLGDRQPQDTSDGDDEVGSLQAKVSDLTRQKAQLTDHIAMVATENRQLWSRLSRLTKDTRSPKAPPSPVASQNLLRSKTFTQNAPNPKLRDKLPDTENLSLEEISLQMLNEVTDAKQQLEKSCQEIMSTSDGEALMGFGFLGEDTTDGEGDLTEKLTKGLERYKKLKTTMVKQQCDLKILLDEKKTQKLKVCRTCEERASITKPVTVSIDSQTDFEEEQRSTTPSPMQETPNPPVVPPQPLPRNLDVPRIDFLEQKRLADVLDKMCPMCGMIYSTTSKFEEFQEHVESHFVDENEMDLSLDRNYEIVSNF